MARLGASEKLERGLRERGALCVGLDPDPERLPPAVRGDVAAFLCDIVAATQDLACAYKLNAAFFEALGLPGLVALERVRQAIPPSAFIIWDAKRGDIANTNRFYARAAFETWDADAVTVQPYLGLEPLAPFFDYRDRMTLVLCATSEGHRMQQLLVKEPSAASTSSSEEPLYLWLTRQVAAWSRREGAARNIGLVVGATVPAQLSAVRALAPELPLLVPGVGAQGGSWPAPPALVNVSRAVLYADPGADFAQAARRAAQELVHVRN